MVLSCKISFTPLHFSPTNIIPRIFFLPFHRSTFNLHILLTGKRADAPCLAYAREKKKLADPLHLPALVCLSWMWTGRRSAICSSSPSDVRGEESRARAKEEEAPYPGSGSSLALSPWGGNSILPSPPFRQRGEGY